MISENSTALEFKEVRCVSSKTVKRPQGLPLILLCPDYVAH